MALDEVNLESKPDPSTDLAPGLLPFARTLSGSLTLGRLASPLGQVLVLTDGLGQLAGYDFASHEARLHRLAGRYWPGIALAQGKVPSAVAQAHDAYFSGDLLALARLPMVVSGTPFQRQAWTALRTIPAGEVWSYGQQARAIGRDKAVRACGSANGANPIGIAIPCHRVLAANGGLGGYAGGLERKAWLLAHERG